MSEETPTAAKLAEGVQKAENKFLSALPPELEQGLKDEAARCAPDEAVGFVLNNGGALSLMPVKNAAKEAGRYFRVNPDDFEKAEDASDSFDLYHSHVQHSPEPSMADKSMSERHKIKLWIVSHPVGEIQSYTPNGWRAPLVKRPWCYGEFDCLSLLCDHHKEKLNIDVPNFARTDDPKDNNCLENVAAAGFEKVEELQPHDVLLFQIKSPDHPNHIGIYVGDGVMLHHLQDRLSEEIPFVENFGYYAKNCYGIFRHKSMMEKKDA